MASEVQVPFGFELGEQELQELVTAGKRDPSEFKRNVCGACL